MPGETNGSQRCAQDNDLFAKPGTDFRGREEHLEGDGPKMSDTMQIVNDVSLFVAYSYFLYIFFL